MSRLMGRLQDTIDVYIDDEYGCVLEIYGTCSCTMKALLLPCCLS